MAAVTVNRRRTNVSGSRKEKFFEIDIAATGDTLQTRLKKIESVEVLGAQDDKIVGEAVLVSGTVTVAEPRVKTTDHILISRKTAGGTVGDLRLGTITDDTSFVISSAGGSDTSTVKYQITKQRISKIAISGGQLTFTVNPNVALAGVRLKVTGF